MADLIQKGISSFNMANLPPLAPRLKKKKRAKTNPEQRKHYGIKHQNLRKEGLSIFPICQHCNKSWATDAAHKVYPANSVDDYYFLCHPCHIVFDRKK